MNFISMQKWLILCNLKELYEAFKSTYPLLKVGFSKFCSLRPKWCVLAGATGTPWPGHGYTQCLFNTPNGKCIRWKGDSQ